MLVIVGAKCGKSRWVPIHATTQKVLADYVRQRDQVFRRVLPYFFVSRRGNRLDGGQVRRTFYRLSAKLGCADQCQSRATSSRLSPPLCSANLDWLVSFRA